LNNDLSRGFSEGKDDLPAASFTISRVQVKVQLAALRLTFSIVEQFILKKLKNNSKIIERIPKSIFKKNRRS